MRVSRPAPVGRLTRRPEFLAAATGRRFRTERMTLQGRLRGEDEATSGEAAAASGLRVGFTLTKRVGNAVVRNRIRRRLRAALAEAGAAHLSSRLDVVVVGRIDALACPFDLLVADLDRGIDAVARPKTPSQTARPQTPRPPAGSGPGAPART